jgi:hypothetical protein
MKRNKTIIRDPFQCIVTILCIPVVDFLGHQVSIGGVMVVGLITKTVPFSSSDGVGR